MDKESTWVISLQGVWVTACGGPGVRSSVAIVLLISGIGKLWGARLEH